ncbi:MAG: divergent PAP2 family protein [Patescibacteria group bacterium]|jgi:hypothetical protein
MEAIPKLLAIPALVGILVAFIKIVDAIAKHELSWKTFTAYGGMPSFHTAFVVSLTTVVGMNEGIDSAAFAIAAIFSMIVIRDAMGFRRYIGAQARIVNSLTAVKKTQMKALEPLEERVGHTPLEVLMGGIIGFVLSASLYLILP